jgi:nuclease S1
MVRAGRRVVLRLVALALVPSQGFAWGREGHQVLANLAQSRLSPQARNGIAALLHGATLAWVPTYADNYRNNHPEMNRTENLGERIV